MPSFILPAPSQIATAFWTWREALLLEHLPITLAETLAGLIVSVILGVAVAAAMHLSPVVNRLVYPVIVASQTIPVIALSPLFLFWFGYSFAQKVAVVVLITFFPVAVNTADGLRSADRELLAWMRASGADRWRILRMVEAPNAMPHFFTGLKQAATISVIGAVIGEWLGGQSGLGIFGRRASSSLKTPELFASVILLAVMGGLLFSLVSWAERRFMAYRSQDHL
ncbi:ABC transporter, permease [Stigmatella aurantiaca DW4/3-1]|nr:ABC transporter, permease [Stigmatella aurantiaca DW4/3-1]